MDCELVCLRHVSGHELRATVLERREKRDISTEPVQLRDDQGCASEFALGERRFELGTLVYLTGLNFHKLSDELPTASCQKPLDGVSLGFESETALSLL